MPRTKAKPAAWRSRIVGHDSVPPASLVPNPSNWRSHPSAQREALGQILGEVGWVQDCIVNRTTGHLIDGHARLELALERAEATLPVVYVELSEDEERRVLLTLDPLGAMAETNAEAFAALLDGQQLGEDAISRMLAEAKFDVLPWFAPVDATEQSQLDERALVECPQCGHRFDR